jgi:uncharacterized protein
MSATLSPSLAPIASAERLQTLDVVRGFALLGILLMNIEAMAGPLLAAMTGLDPTLRGADRWVDALTYIVVQGKFYTLFALLFGMGFAVMSQRAQAAGRAFAGVYWRRGLVLLAIGLMHALLIWSGDVLVSYALLSFLLLAFRDVPARWLPWLAALSYLMTSGFMLALSGLGSLMQLDPQAAAEWNKAMGGQGEVIAALVEGQRQAFGAGGFLEATLQRAKDFGFAMINLPAVGPQIFAMFLLGGWFVKSDAIARPQDYARLFRTLRWLVLPLGLAMMLCSFLLLPTMDLADIDIKLGIAYTLSAIGGVLMSLGYLAWIVRGLQSVRWASALAWFAPAGRMALTNYLLQSIVCTWLFYGYGLGYFEKLPRVWHVPLVLVLFALQVLASRWWLRRFRFGPMEWVWRSLTYLKAQPMRLRPV